MQIALDLDPFLMYGDHLEKARIISLHWFTELFILFVCMQ